MHATPIHRFHRFSLRLHGWMCMHACMMQRATPAPCHPSTYYVVASGAGVTPPVGFCCSFSPLRPRQRQQRQAGPIKFGSGSAEAGASTVLYTHSTQNHSNAINILGPTRSAECAYLACPTRPPCSRGIACLGWTSGPSCTTLFYFYF